VRGTAAHGAKAAARLGRAALLMFMFHRHLVANPADDPADALRAAQLWMLTPRWEIPAQMPSALAGQARRQAARSPQSWAAFTYYGQ
jgi:CHAT domain-containing protein